MGCDIHLYIEYKRKDRENFNDFGQRFNPGRNYYMFGLLSKGVRTEPEGGMPAKGLPDLQTLGYSSKGDLSLYITEDGNGENECTRERAEKWVADDSSVYTDERKLFVTNPDYHSHSWLTASEYEKQIALYNSHPDAIRNREPEYEAVLAAMKLFETLGYESRIVFWFDN